MNTNSVFSIVFVLALFLIHGCGNEKETSSSNLTDAESIYPFSFDELLVTGRIYKNNQKETLEFDLQIGDENANYTVKGSPATVQGNVNTDLDFSGVRVVKMTWLDKSRQTKTFKNSGKIKIWMRERDANELILSEVPISGSFLQGRLNDGVWFKGLKVDGEDSSGCLDYNTRNGHYNSKGGCSFGSCKISTSDKSGKCTMDYDNSSLYPSNAMTYKLSFGNMILFGLVNFTDKKGTDGQVIAATGKLTLKIKKDGNEKIFLSQANLMESSDEKTIRKLIAFIQLTAFDFWSE